MSAGLEADMLADLAALGADPEVIRLELTKLDAWQLVAALQLACRHPCASMRGGPVRYAVERFIGTLAPVIAPTPALVELLRRGWLAEYDE